MNYYKNQLNKFNTIYRRANSVNGINDAYFVRKTKLGNIFIELLKELEKVKDYDVMTDFDFNFSVRLYQMSSNLNTDKTPWLFYEKLPEDYVVKLMEVIAVTNDANLTKSDYILLLHASYENERMEGALTGLPLGMLYDVFTPVYEEAYERWHKKKFSS
jgi:hypothetical protein